MTRRLGVYAHYHPLGDVKGFVVAHLAALRPLCERLVFVSTAQLTESAKAKVASLCDVCYQLPNVGYDFWMWRHALDRDGRGAAYDEVLLTNSSVFGPVGDLSATVQRMSASPCDYWGINESDELEKRCFQSYFFVFKRPVIDSVPWANFWARVEPLADKWQVITRYELGISVQLREAGFRSASQVPILPGQGRGNPTLQRVEDMLRHGCHFVKVSVLPMVDVPRQKSVLNLMAASGYDVRLVQELMPGAGLEVVLGVPTLNRYDLCKRLLASAFDGTRPPDCAVVVDNGGGFEWSGARPVQIVRPGSNLGVGPSWNLLARRCLKGPDDLLLVCGDDVTLRSDTIEKLLATTAETGADFVYPDPSRSTEHQVFSCFLARPSLFEKVGYFDERFWPAYFEDDDFGRRMELSGATKAIAPCGYDHVNSATMKAYSAKELERHHERFRACRSYYALKWGGVPGEEQFSVPFDGSSDGQVERARGYDERMIVEHFFQHIDGWFDFDDIYADAVREASDGAIFVEVGSWLGRSSAFMAVEIENSGKDIKFYCVDTWQGSPKSGGYMRSRFVSNMRGLDVVPIESDSALAADRFEDESIDFVFIDASHEYDAVSRDIAAWYPKVRRGGIIAGHDVGWQGLLGAVQERLPATEVEVRRSSWWHRKKSSGFKLSVPGSHLMFIPVVNRPDLLAKALASVPAKVATVVVDQSHDGFAANTKSHATVIRPPTRLSFSQMQNLMLRVASEHDVRELLFMHSDGECEPSVVSTLLGRARSRSQDDWGVMFTHHDVLAAFNARALLKRVGFWDETFRWYRSDCDYYHRVRKAGLLTIDTGLPVVHHASSTIRSSAKEAQQVEAESRWHRDHYVHKWGGETGHERNAVPYVG